jgi:thiol:disulfide interchange protein DsbC
MAFRKHLFSPRSLRIALALTVLAHAALSGFGETSPVVSTTPEAQAAFDKFSRGPYRPMATGRVPRTTLVKGIYALAVPGGRISPVFVDADATIIKNGGQQRFDGRSRTPLPADRVAAINSKMAAQIELSSAIVEKFGNGSRKVVMVSAYDCPICRGLERQLRTGHSDATVYILPITLDPNDPSLVARLESLLCASDPSALWQAVMVQNARLPTTPPAGCARKFEAVNDMELLFSQGNGRPFVVPALIRPDGSTVTAKPSDF